MYEPFFGMQRRPFSATPDSSCFFACDSSQAALDELCVCVERGQGIGILAAPAGMGKTLLCQRLTAEVSGQFESVVLGSSNFPTRRSLLQAILFEMGDEYSRKDEAELRLDLRSRLLSLRPARQALVLVVDEAHLFGDELLEEVRTLSDIADESSPLVRVILSGQPELEERLTSRSFDALNQRISNQVYLESLTLTESRQYLEHRLTWAGASIDSVFSPEAVDVIARASDGVARCLNQLADHCLLLAFASDEQPVQKQTVLDALEDMKQLPLHWNDVSTGETVVGWQEDEEEEFEEPQLPETDVATDAVSEIDDAPPHVTIGASEVAPEVSPAAADDVVEEVETTELAESAQACETDETGTIEETPAPAAVIEFGAPIAVETVESEESAVEALEASESPVIESVQSAPAIELPVEVVVEVSGDSAEAAAVEDVPGLCFEITSDGCRFDPAAAAGEAEHSDSEAVPQPLAESDDSGFVVTSEASTAEEAEAADFESELPAAIEFGGGIGAEIENEDSLPEPAEADPISEMVAESHEEMAVVDIVDGIVDEDSSGESEFEEEVVLDHYSAIAEPQSTGIIWNLVGNRVENVSPAAPVESGSVDTVESEFDTDNCPDEPVAEETGVSDSEEDVRLALVGDSDVSVDAETAEVADAAAEDVSSADIIEPETSETSTDDILAEVVAEEDSLEDQTNVQDTADEPLVAAHDDQVMGVRPDSRIDALVPLLDELSGNAGNSDSGETHDRSLLDIEAELVQTVEYGQPDIEDEIGVAILDMCLETQAEIHQAREPQQDDSADEETSGFDDAILGTLPESNDSYSFGDGPFDIVQPEDEDGSASFRFDAPTSDEHLGTEGPVESGPASRTRPFGRLFSELRRRQRQAG